MRISLRLFSLLLCIACLLSGCAKKSPDDTPATSNATDAQTTTSSQSEELKMPSYLCDIVDTVNLEKVLTTPTFSISDSLTEDTNRSLITPHFTVDSHMVLQRRAVNLIRGRTTDAHVAVRFGDQTYYGTVENGSFAVYLPPMEADIQKDLVILSDNAKLTLSDVCVGEVFLLGGQSNMVWSLGWSGELHKNDIANATEENIRILRMNHTESLYERADAEGDVQWERINPESSKNFSAIGYLFAKRLHKELNVPIGLVQSAVSGSTIAFWFPADTYAEYINGGGVAYSATNSGNLTPCLGYNGMIAPLLGMRFRGMVWYQGEANVADNAYYFDQLKLLIQTYRENFNAPNMAVTVIELAKATADHAEKWAPVKAAQQRAAKELENVAYSVSIDLGYHVDVHPREKTEYARRAAEITLNKFFGIAINLFPTVVSAQRVNEKLLQTIADYLRRLRL